jgi:DNA-binding NarL/FixJ family response regulator
LYLGKFALARAGVRNPVVTAGGGVEAIDFLRSTCQAAGAIKGSKPGVVLLDIKMPVVNGFKVLQWLKTKKALQHTKVVMLTSSTDPADATRAADLGADGYVVKYPTPDALAKIVEAALQVRTKDREEGSPPAKD